MSTTETIQAWSTTNATNATADAAIGSSDTQSPDTLDNNIRSIMVAAKKFAKDTGGALSAGGSANALTVTTSQVLQSGQITDGLRLLLKATADNSSTTVTFAPDGLTAANIKRADGTVLAVGSIKSGMYLDLVYNSGSSEWRCANIQPAVTAGVTAVTKQVFTSSGTYTPTAGMKYCIIECVGGGGGGGGLVNSAAGARNTTGGGGGGGYSRLLASAATIGASQIVTIGAAGVGGAAGGANNGTAGGDTSVDALCIAKGGSGGGGGSAGAGGAGGIAGTGDFSVPGQAGTAGLGSAINTVDINAGNGGSSGLGFGAGAIGPSVQSNGANGGLYGGGGSGACTRNAGGAAAGGNGTAGIVVITEFN